MGVECLWNAHLHRVGCGSPGSRAHVGGMVGVKGRNVGGGGGKSCWRYSSSDTSIIVQLTCC